MDEHVVASYRIPRGALKISRTMTANRCCLALAGTLDRDTAATLPSLVEQLAERSAGILIDVSDLASIDEAGVCALKHCREVCHAHQVVLSVSGLKGTVRQTVEASGEADQPPFVRG